MKKDKSGEKEPKATKVILTKSLPCKLTEKEMAKAGKDLAENMDKVEAIEAKKKTADSEFKKDIGLLDEVTTTLRGMLKSGSQDREVKCEEVTDYRAGEVRIKRLDTGEVFTRRNLSKTEAQLPLATKPAEKLLAMDGGKGKELEGEEETPPIDPEPLTAKLGEVAAAHETPPAIAKKKSRKTKTNPNDVDDTPPEGCAF